MRALPSIAFNDFSGTAGDVTARFVNGHSILTVSTGEKSGDMLAVAKFTASESNGD